LDADAKERNAAAARCANGSIDPNVTWPDGFSAARFCTDGIVDPRSGLARRFLCDVQSPLSRRGLCLFALTTHDADDARRAGRIPPRRGLLCAIAAGDCDAASAGLWCLVPSLAGRCPHGSYGAVAALLGPQPRCEAAAQALVPAHHTHRVGEGGCYGAFAALALSMAFAKSDRFSIIDFPIHRVHSMYLSIALNEGIDCIILYDDKPDLIILPNLVLFCDGASLEEGRLVRDLGTDGAEEARRLVKSGRFAMATSAAGRTGT
jgi:hypothetical protein